MKIQWVRNVKPERKDKEATGKKGEETSKKGTNDKASTAAGGEDKSQGGETQSEEAKQVFTVVPDNIVLNPKMGIMIQFRANSPLTGKIIENWLCNVTSGGERKPKVAYNSNVVGDFIIPQLNFSEAKLFFKYLWEKGVPSMPISKHLEITNGGPLPTSMNLLIDPPFSCATEKL
jgi:hydrocephalus-inducing protein